MAQIVRDPKLSVPPRLNEEEQQATMLKAAKQRGGVHNGEELTVVPVGTPPLGGAWTAVGTISAPGSGTPYKIYLKTPPRRGPGTIGTRNNHPISDAGTMPLIQSKPNVPSGTYQQEGPQPAKNPLTDNWLAGVASDGLNEAAEALGKVLENPAASEEQIGEKVRGGLAAARRVELVGGGDDPKLATLMQQVGKAVDRVAEMRTAAFEDALRQEERVPGSVSEQKLKDHIQKGLSGERQRQLLGVANETGPSKAMELVGRAIGIVADRKADAVQNLLDQDKRSPGSVTDTRFSQAIGDLLGMVRETELLGISRPKTNDALASIAEVMKVVVQRKTEARQKLIQQRNLAGSGVTDQQIQQATDDLNQIKEQARRVGVSIP
jgi:hypothetical protein